MNERYTIINTYICPFSFVNEYVKPNFDYPIRLCVLDTQKNIIVDIEHELMYDFIKTNENINLCIGEKKKIKENKRFGIISIIDLDSEKETLEKAKKIIENLKNDFKYPDGNDILNNEEYLYLINNQEKNEMSKKQVQKIIKRKKN